VEVNFGQVANYYAKFRNDLPNELIESLKTRGIDFSNQKVIDLGAGTGVLTRVLKKNGAMVLGIEPSTELIQVAKEMDKLEGYEIEYIHTYAEEIPLPDQTVDIVTAFRAWHWFDTKKVLDEVKRILKPNGTLLVMDSGFVVNRKVVKDTLEIIQRNMPDGKLKAAGAKSKSKQRIIGFPVEWFQEWQEYGFDLTDTYKFYYHVTFTNEEWCGRIGSVSWLASFNEEKRNKVLEEIYSYLEKEYQGVLHDIQHNCSIAILKL